MVPDDPVQRFPMMFSVAIKSCKSVSANPYSASANSGQRFLLQAVQERRYKFYYIDKWKHYPLNTRQILAGR